MSFVDLHLATPATGAAAKPAPPSKGTTSPPAVSSSCPPHHDALTKIIFQSKAAATSPESPAKGKGDKASKKK